MGSGITGRDALVLVGAPAWHGLGAVVPEAPTVREAVRMVLPWEVEAVPALWEDGRRSDDVDAAIRPAPGQVVLRVDPDGECYPLAVVGKGYRPFPNAEFAGLAEAIAEAGGCKVETAGSLYGGRRVFMLLRTGEREVVPGDPTAEYVAVLNGHDGCRALRAFPTSVRVVCANTEARAEAGARGIGLAVAHGEGMRAKVESFKRAVLAAGAGHAAAGEEDRAMASLGIGRSSTLATYFERVYERWTGRPFPDPEPADRAGERALARAEAYIGPMLAEFEHERQAKVAGTVYAALQSVTRVADWERPAIEGGRVRDWTGDRILGAGAKLKAAARAEALALL